MLSNGLCAIMLFISICGHGLSQSASPPRDPLDRPNIILFLADDMGYGDLASYGHPSQEYGPVDQMAHEGMRFSRWYSPESLCSPSRGAMLTGRLPVRVGLYGPTKVFEMDSSYGLPKSEITMAEMLRDVGYHTGMVGKWHQGINEFTYNDGNHLPHHHGFDYVGTMLPFSNHWTCDETKLFVDTPDRYYCVLYYNDTIIQQPLSHRNLTERLVFDAKAFIYEHRRDPFFFFFSFPQPHVDMFSSPRFSKSSKRGRYGDSLNEMSWAVGETLEAIREVGLERNTLAVFLSDHGPQIELCSEGGSSGILKGGKTTAWEGGIRVPAIAWWPGIIKPGSYSRDIVSSMDLYATFAELAGGKLPSDRIMDTASIVPILTHGGKSSREVLLHYCGDILMAVTYNSFKMHLFTKHTLTPDEFASSCGAGWFPKRYYYLCPRCDSGCVTEQSPPLLYNMDVDPAELSPLDVEKYSSVISEIHQIIKQHDATLVKGPPLFQGEQNLHLNPCCNPPYCMCNYERQTYLSELCVDCE